MRPHTPMCAVMKYADRFFNCIAAEMKAVISQRDSHLFVKFRLVLVGADASGEIGSSYSQGNILRSATTLY